MPRTCVGELGHQCSSARANHRVLARTVDRLASPWDAGNPERSTRSDRRPGTTTPAEGLDSHPGQLIRLI